MRRWCTEGSRSYPGRSVCHSVGPGVSVITAIPEAPCMATHTVGRQKSAEGIVGRVTEGPNVEVSGGLP